MATTRERIMWIDWMKTIAMFCVIWGHCFPTYLTAFFHTFNIPAFLILSGYLSRKDTRSTPFWPKFWTALVVPYLLLAFIKAAGAIVKGFPDGSWLTTTGAILGGFHSLDGAQGCSNLWFVYSLIIIRLIHHLTHGSLRWMGIFSVVTVIAAWVLHYYVEMPRWAVSDTLMTLPFYTIGFALRQKCETQVNRLKDSIGSMNPALAVLSIVGTLAAAYGISYLNGKPNLYKGDFGSNPLLLTLGAIAGTMFLFFVCVRLNNIHWKGATIISTGNIVILTFHRELLHEPIKYINKGDFAPWLQVSLYGLSSLVVILLFIPICWLIIRYVPILVGKRKA